MKKTAATLAWWEKLLGDAGRLNAWLVRLYNNEKDAYERFRRFAHDYCANNLEAQYLFLFIAEQEFRHAEIVLAVLQARGIPIGERVLGPERYWDKVLPCVCDMESAAGVGALAEGLSLERFRVLIRCDKTPADLLDMFRQIEPDETLHARALANLAGQHGIKSVIDCHSAGLEALGLKLKADAAGKS